MKRHGERKPARVNVDYYGKSGNKPSVFLLPAIYDVLSSPADQRVHVTSARHRRTITSLWLLPPPHPLCDGFLSVCGRCWGGQKHFSDSLCNCVDKRSSMKINWNCVRVNKPVCNTLLYFAFNKRHSSLSHSVQGDGGGGSRTVKGIPIKNSMMSSRASGAMVRTSGVWDFRSIRDLRSPRGRQMTNQMETWVALHVVGTHADRRDTCFFF